MICPMCSNKKKHFMRPKENHKCKHKFLCLKCFVSFIAEKLGIKKNTMWYEIQEADFYRKYFYEKQMDDKMFNIMKDAFKGKQ